AAPVRSPCCNFASANWVWRYLALLEVRNYLNQSSLEGFVVGDEESNIFSHFARQSLLLRETLREQVGKPAQRAALPWRETFIPLISNAEFLLFL
ncbi:hypothetical protein, partial [uncultured Nostoc sp.]|uniref:hypothetical protein n=1 Tax=uncultured Nostoc sp. TaxID=340711 RepID=UPI0026046055